MSDAADLHAMKGVEDATRKNVIAGIAHNDETRAEMADMKQQLVYITNLVSTLSDTVGNLNAQVGYLRAQVLGGGPTSGG